MFVEENRQRVHMYEPKLFRIWDKIRQLEVKKKRLNNHGQLDVDHSRSKEEVTPWIPRTSKL
jgi:hypothetical protein